MNTLKTRPASSDYLAPGLLKCQKVAKIQNNGFKNTKSVLLEEIMQFVSSIFINMFYKLIDNEHNKN